MEENWEGDADEIIEWDEYPIEAFPENIRNYMQEIVKKKSQVSNELVGGNVFICYVNGSAKFRKYSLSRYALKSFLPKCCRVRRKENSGHEARSKTVFNKKGMQLNEQYNQEMKVYNAELEGWRKGRQKERRTRAHHSLPKRTRKTQVSKNLSLKTQQ